MISKSKKLAPAWFLRSLAACGAITIFGCAHREPEFDRVAIAGTISIDGEPMESGNIRFVPLANTNGPKTTHTVLNGRFESDAANGPCLGEHKVEIELTGSEQYGHDDEEALARLQVERVRLRQPKLPAIDNESSTLKATIERDGNPSLEFKLNTR